MTPGETVLEFIRRVELKKFDAASELLALDVHYDNVPMEPKHDGRGVVKDLLENFLGGSPKVEWRVHRQAETAGTVMNERTDCFELGGQWLEIPVAGIWQVGADGLISLWRDYFDMGALTTQAG
jgi:limonene-1,2-epoxide hydrolase